MSVLISGCPTDQLCMEKGLKQGDSLSPFIFNTLIKALNSVLLNATDLNLLKGVRLGLGEVNITHRQFTDDTIVFIEPSMQSLLTLKRILRCFKIVFGLQINFHKSSLARVGKSNSPNKEWDYVLRCRKLLFRLPILVFCAEPTPEL
ncbi:hypothetical protein Dsin_016363 [Dipteronia sinensis]|uniref:Reverse transcriptase domain-containing protein n=1 Tax=Dipteronia sinensis TaxID=43782 RepID=A0AAE0E5N0_9ROSI|nr:hypothetical protein Dsin_016363 [Dipteronia sinensis]